MSGASESSFSTAHESTNEGFRPNNISPGDDDSFFDDPHTVQLGVFGVLYTVSKEKQLTSVKFAFFRLFLDFLQLWLLVVNPQYGWSINGQSRVWEVVSFIQLNLLTSRGYTFFLALLYVFVGLLVVNLALSVWVAHSFSNNRFDHVWPIQFLRWFGLIFYQVLDIATLTLLLVSLDCNYLASDKEVKFHNQEFPDVACWSMPHLVHVAVSVSSIILFVLAATSMVLSEMELNPLTRNYTAIAHTRDEGLGFAIKIIVTIASVMLSSSLKVMAVAYLFFFILLLYIYVKWVPFIYSTLNYVRCGSYATVLYSSVLLVFLAFGPQKEDYRKQVTLALWIGMAPAALLGAFLCHMRLHHFARVLDRFRDAETGTNSKHIYRFTDVREVQIMARCCRHWIDEDTLEPEAVALSEQVIKAGMMQLPHDPQMIIVYSSFLIDVQGSYQSGYTQLQTAKKQSPGVLERFAIFSREQEHTQKASGAHSGDSSVDLVSYVEFQRNHRLVLRAHREALLAIRAFWGLLLRSNVNFNHLSKALNRIETTVKSAERAYRSVLQRHGGSARIVRLYGKFLESVKFDPWAASKWYMEADRLDEEAEHSKEALQMGGIEPLMPQQGGTSTETRIGICINAQGIIQVASNEAYSLLGYAKNELKGKDVGIIMPPPFSERHTAYVRNYVQTGVSSMLGRNLEVVVVTKTRQVLPVQMHVTKVSGLNEDSIFLGMFEPLPVVPGDARMWVLGTGVIIAADSVFCDWLGFEPADLVGKTVEEFLVDKEAVRDVIKGWNKNQQPSSRSQPAGRNRLAPMSMGDALSAAFGLPSPVPGDKGDRTDKAERALANGPADKVSLGWLRRASFVDQVGATHGRSVDLPGGEATAASQRLPPPVLLQREKWRHKFCQAMEFDTYLKPGALGGIKVHSVIIRRCPMRAGATFLRALPDTNLHYHEMMLVADHKGKVLHASASLATALGRTPDGIRAGGIQMLLPEPTSVLHGPWLMELSNPQPLSTVSPDNPPPLSCRSGVAVSLATYDPLQGPGLKQFRMAVNQRLLEGGAGKVHVVSLQAVSLCQAFSERRLSLTLDLKGTILSADESTPARLFGADPRDLPGTSIAALVDLFQMDEQDRILMGADELGRTGYGLHTAKSWSDNVGMTGTGAGGYGGGGSGPASAPYKLEEDMLEFTASAAQEAFSHRLAKALLQLAQRSSDSPGCSWRVGVNQPPDEQARVELEQMAAVLGPEGLSAAARLVGSKRVPAVMTVRLVRRQPQPLKEPEPPSPRTDIYSSGDASSYSRHYHKTRDESCLAFNGARGREQGDPNLEYLGRAEMLNGTSTASNSPDPGTRMNRRSNEPSIAAELRAKFAIPGEARAEGQQPREPSYSGGAAGEDSYRGQAQREALLTSAGHPGVWGPVTRAPGAGPAAALAPTAPEGYSRARYGMAGGPVAEATEAEATDLAVATSRSRLDWPLSPEEEATLEQIASSNDGALTPPTPSPPSSISPSTRPSERRSPVQQGPAVPTLPPNVQQHQGASVLAAAVAAAVERASSGHVDVIGPPAAARASRFYRDARQASTRLVLTQPAEAMGTGTPAEVPQAAPAAKASSVRAVGFRGMERSPVSALAPAPSHPSQRTQDEATATPPGPGNTNVLIWPIHSGTAKSLDLTPGPGTAQVAVPTPSTDGFQAPCLVLEVELWRADLLSGVLEVDERGRVLQTDVHCPLGQSGLVLGTPLSSIPGRQVSELLPLPPGSVAALLEPSAATAFGGAGVHGQGNSAFHAVSVRGALKKRGGRTLRVGPPTIMTVRHQSDGCALSLQVQAVRRSGPAGYAFLCIRPAVPSTVQPGFARWLLDEDASGLMPSLSTTGYTLTPQTGPRSALARAPSSFPPGSGLSGSSKVQLHMNITARTPCAEMSPMSAFGALGEKTQQAAAAAVGAVSGPQTPLRMSAPTSMDSGGLAARDLLPGAPALQVSLTPPPALSRLTFPTDHLISSVRTSNLRGSLAATAGASSRLAMTTLPEAATSAAPGGGAESMQGPGPAFVSSASAAGMPASAEGRKAPSPETPKARVSLDTMDTAYDPYVTRSPDQSGSLGQSGSADLTVCNGAGPASALLRTTATLAPGLDSALGPAQPVASSRTGKFTDGKQSMVQSWVITSGEVGVKGDAMDMLRSGEIAQIAGSRPVERERFDAARDMGNGGEGDGLSLDGAEGDPRSSLNSSDSGGERRDPRRTSGEDSKDESTEVESEAGAHVANYSVGKRFKKLFKMLMSPRALQPARRLRWHTVGAMFLLVGAHTVVFVLLLVKLLQQQAAVNDLDSVSEAARKVHEIAINGLVLDSLYRGDSYVEGLPQFGEPVQEAIDSLYVDLTSVSYQLKDLHHGVYLGFRQLRRIKSAYGLRAIWDEPRINISIFYDLDDPDRPGSQLPDSTDPIVVPMGLWEAGNYYYAKTLDVINNGQRKVDLGVNFTSWASWRFIRVNGVPVIFGAYLETLDALVQITVEESNSIYRLQLIVLLLEGVLMCIFICIYMWFAARRYSKKRHELYGIFIQIPVGIIRGLANMSLVLEAADEEEDDDQDLLAQRDLSDGGGIAVEDNAVVLTDGAIKAVSSDKRVVVTEGSMGRRNHVVTLTGTKPRGSATFGNTGSKTLEDDAEAGGVAVGNGDVGGRTPSTRLAAASTFLSNLMKWRKRSQVSPELPSGQEALQNQGVHHHHRQQQTHQQLHPQKHKRRLLDSNRLAVAMVMPFMLWGAAIIAVNVVGYYSMEKLSAPIATLNVVHVVVIRFHRVLYYALEVVTATSYAACDYFKGLLSLEIQNMLLEYNAMLYGREAVPNSDSPHFRLAATGVLFGGYSSPAELLYHTTDCLAEDPAECQPPGSPYYQVTHNGLDVLLRSQLSAMESLITQPVQSSNLNSTEFGLIWATGQTDLEGGLSYMSDTFLFEVQGSYRRVVIQQIVMFCVTWVWVLLFMLIQLRPLVRKAQNEMRRIAELLSQLPGEVDCEALVTNVILGESASIMPAGLGRSMTAAATKTGPAAEPGATAWAAARKRSSAGGVSISQQSKAADTTAGKGLA